MGLHSLRLSVSAGLTRGMTTALSSNKESELQAAAALLAAGQIETLRAEGYIADGTDEGQGGEGLSLYRWKQSVSRTSIDGLHEVEVVVENANSGKTIYELRTLLFDPPSESLLEDTSKRKEPARSRRTEGRKR